MKKKNGVKKQIITSCLCFFLSLFIILTPKSGMHEFPVIAETKSVLCPSVPQKNETSRQVNITNNLVYPCGFPIGIYLQMDGVLVIGIGQVRDQNGLLQNPADGILQSGDYILAVNGTLVKTKEELIEKIQLTDGKSTAIAIRRDGKELICQMTPVQTAEDEYRIGVWVKDDIQGIGTLTYFQSNGAFGALGHPINDLDTGSVVSIREGGLFQAQIQLIIRGTSGTPGSFSGIICYDQQTRLGDVSENTAKGIFGTLTPETLSKLVAEQQPMPAVSKTEVKKGKAWVRCTLEQETRDYEIEITDLNLQEDENRSIRFQVTDPELLEQTGGIIQGMGVHDIRDNLTAAAKEHERFLRKI